MGELDTQRTGGVRAFAAVPVVAPAVSAALEEAQIDLRRTGAVVKWVAAHQFHFTLQFLGSIPSQRFGAAQVALRRAADMLPGPFSLELTGLGAFPRPEAARVVWVGCGEGGSALTNLAQAVMAEMAAAGFPAERRPFSPHLTLGRVRDNGYRPALGQALCGGAGWRFGYLSVTEVVLFRSDLQPMGPVYTPLGRYPLGAGQQCQATP